MAGQSLGSEGAAQRLAPLWAGLLAVVPHAGVLLGRQEFYYDDHFRFSTPLASLVAEAIRSHHLPLWNPWILTGTPLVAERGGLVAHPGLLLALVLPASHAVGVLMVSLLFVLAAGSTALLRALSVRTLLALGVGAALGLSGPALSYTSNAQFLATLAFLPLVLLSAVRMAEGKGSVLGGGLALGMALLGGDLPGALVIAVIAFFVFLAAGGRMGQAWPRLLGLAGVGLAVGAGSWLPVLWALPMSERGAGIVASEAGRWSFHPGEILGFIWPHPLGLPLPRFTFWPFRWLGQERLFLHSVWVGALLSVAAFLGLRRRSVARTLTLIAVVLIVAGTGAWTPLWVILRPLFTFVRYPSKLVAPAALLLALAGAVVLEQLLARPRSLRNLCLTVTGLGAFGALAGSLVQASLARRAGVGAEIVAAASTALRTDATRVALLAGLAAALFHFVSRGRLSAQRAVPLLAGLIFLDVFTATADLSWTRPVLSSPRPAYLGPGDARGPRVMRLEEISQQRLALNEQAFSEEQLRQAALLMPLTNLAHHVGILDPYGLYLSDVALAMAEIAAANPVALAEVTATDFVLAAPGSRAPWLANAVDNHRLSPVAAVSAGALVLRVAEPLPRSFVTRAATLLARAEIPQRLVANTDRVLLSAERGLRAGSFGSLDALAIPEALIHAETSKPAAVQPTHWRPGAADYRVGSDAPALLVEMDAFAPGWRVFVDGQESTILQADVFGRAVVVPAGNHDVRWRFAPRLVEAALVTTWFSLGAVLLGLVLQRRSRAMRVG